MSELTPPKNKSSMVAAVGHDPETNTLAVQFDNGDVGHYQNVDAELFAEFRDSDSAGSFLHKTFRKNPDKYPFTKVQDKGKE